MAKPIASGAAILTANADGLKSGLDKSLAMMQQWGSRAKKLVGGAVAGAAVGFGGAKVLDTIGDIGRMGGIAQAMGLTGEQFSGMAGVAGSVGMQTREFIESLVTLGKLGTEAAAGTGQAAEAMRGLGIDAQAFVKLNAEEQFFQIWEALSRVQDPLQRTRFLMQAFGEDGGKFLLPLLSKAPEEIRKMAKEFALSNEQVERATKANQAMATLKAGFTKAWQSIVAGIAPVVEGAANFAGRIVKFFAPVTEWLGRAFEQAWQIGVAVWEAIGDAISEVVAWFERSTASLFEWVGELPAVQDVVVLVFRAIGSAAALAWDVIKAGAGAISFVAAHIVMGFSGVLDVFAEVVALAKKMPEWMRPDGLDSFIAGVEGASAAVKSAAHSMKDWGKGAVLGFGGSVDDFNKWLDKALAPKPGGAKAAPLAANLAAIAAAGVAEGVVAGLVEGAQKASSLSLAGAMLQGSREAYSLTVKNQLRGFEREQQPMKKAVKELEKGNRIADRSDRRLREIEEHLGEVGVI